jgi:anti-sigma factor RsiW
MAPARHEGHVEVLLGAYVLGGLSDGEEAVVRAHLNRCARCRADHEELACVPQWLDLISSAAGAAPAAAREIDPGRDAEDGGDAPPEGPADPS